MKKTKDTDKKDNFITLTRDIAVSVYVPDTITDGKERKAYKDRIWKIIRDINNKNFELHNVLVKKLIEIDSILQSQLSNDKIYYDLRQKYVSDRKHIDNKKAYFKYIDEKRNSIIESDGSKNLHGFIYNYMNQYIKNTPLEDIINSYSYTKISKDVVDKYKKDLFDVNHGLKSVAFYKKTQPIPINIRSSNPNMINLTHEWINKYDKKKYTFIFKSSKIERFELSLILGRDKSNNESIIEKLLSGEYKLCDSSIQLNDDKLMLKLSYKQEITKDTTLDINKIMGVDLGMKYAAVISTNFSKDVLKLGEKEFYLLKVKLENDKDKRTLQKNSVFSRGGHGRKRKMQRSDAFGEYEKNFRDTFNHKISRMIVDSAIKWGCGQINVEDLSLIPLKQKNQRVLRNWAYFDLLNKIEYKCKQHGIIFNKVNPAYTSQVCNTCLKIGERVQQDTFICTNPTCNFHNKPINADYNASLNIAKYEQSNFSKVVLDIKKQLEKENSKKKIDLFDIEEILEIS